MKTNNIKRLIFVCLIPFIFFVVSMITLKDYGISWDEPLHFSRGQAYLNYYLTGSKNYDNLSRKGSYYQQDGLSAEYFFENDSAHPPTNDIIAALFNYVFHQKLGVMGDIESFHLFNILTSTLLVFIICLFAFETIGLIGMVVSGFVMATYPLFFAESHFNIKDPAETAFIVLTIYLFWKSLKKFDWKILFFAAVSAGLALGIKFNIVFLPFIILPYLIIRYWRKFPKFPKLYWIILVLSPSIVFFIFYIFWPYLWSDTIHNLVNAVKYYKEIGTGVNTYQLRFMVLGGINLFPICWILITTPPLVLLLGIIGIYVSIFKIKTREKTEILWLLLFMVTVTRVSFSEMSIYGGIRQIMEFLPGLALLSGLGFVFLLNKVNFKVFMKTMLILLLCTFLVYPLFRFHPNENVYFNFLIGGLSGAQDKKIPYWGNSFGNAYLQAVNWVNENVKDGSKIALVQGTSPNIPKIWLRDDLLFSNSYWSGIDRKGEYLIELTHDDPIRAYPYVWGYVEKFLKPVYEVKVDGVAIAKVWKNDLDNTYSLFQRDEIQISASNYKINKQDKEIIITLSKLFEVTRIIFDSKNISDCTSPKGHVEIIENGKTWKKLTESFPAIQMDKPYKKNNFSYYFLADKISSIKFVFDSYSSCALEDSKLIIYTLE